VGIYASSYSALALIHVKVAEARVALLSNNTAAAAEYLQVRCGGRGAERKAEGDCIYMHCFR
jgi:hypothetical protein